MGTLMKRSNLMLAGTALLCLDLAGCGGGSAAPTPQAGTPDSLPRAMTLSTLSQDAASTSGPPSDLTRDAPRDAPSPVHELFRIDIYQFVTPLGSLGRNEDFWKRVDEQCVDVGILDAHLPVLDLDGIGPVGVSDPSFEHLAISQHEQGLSGRAWRRTTLAGRRRRCHNHRRRHGTLRNPRKHGRGK